MTSLTPEEFKILNDGMFDDEGRETDEDGALARAVEKIVDGRLEEQARLLKKYIAHVNECEGNTFLSDHYRLYGGLDFTDDEWTALQNASQEDY